jgi:glycosyltransferase involved in cell wall biosynthesis/ADP-heptose:LPS heptosyltransferase
LRFLIDLQGAQTESRFRGIGRYSISLTNAIIRNRGEHEVFVALNGMLQESCFELHAFFSNILPKENIKIWYGLHPANELDQNNDERRQISEVVREAFLYKFQPDVILISSLFEHDAVTSIGNFSNTIPTVTVLYDLIPLVYPHEYLDQSAPHKTYYYRKFENLKRCKGLLAISQSAKNEALEFLAFKEDDVINISGSYDDIFQVNDISDLSKNELYERHGISRPFVFYNGAPDDRKNLFRLIDAFALLPKDFREKYQLIFAGKMPSDYISRFLMYAKKCGLSKNDFLLLGFVSNDDLVKLYNLCELFVFPSLHEGFGLPPLEAMACGAPVIVSRNSSLIEVVDNENSFFDPMSAISIKEKIFSCLQNKSFKAKLRKHSLKQAKKFSWDAVGIKAIEGLTKFGYKNINKRPPEFICEKTSFISNKTKRILIIKLDHMGDMVLSIPAMSRLRSRYPSAVIDIILGSWNESLAKSLNIFDNVFIYDFFKQKSFVPPDTNDLEIAYLLSKLGEYDISIDFRRYPESRFLLTMIKSSLKIAYQTFDAQIDSNIDILLPSFKDSPFISTPLNEKNMALQLIDLIEAIPKESSDYCLFPSPGSKGGMVSIAIFPNAGNSIKEWGLHNYQELILRLSKNEFIETINVYLSLGEDAQSNSFSAYDKTKIHIGLDYQSLVNSLIKNSICIGNNSFSGHISSYHGLTFLGIYSGQGSVAEWGPPFGESYVISRDLNCSPCHIGVALDCKYNLKCLDIPCDYVYEKVSLIIESLALGIELPYKFFDARIDRTSNLLDMLTDRIASFKFELNDEQLLYLSEVIARNFSEYEV